jgi:hypothetical protein
MNPSCNPLIRHYETSSPARKCPRTLNPRHREGALESTRRPRRSSCVSLLLYCPERAAQVSLGQRPRTSSHESQSPEGANEARQLDRWPGSGAWSSWSGRLAARAEIGRPFRAFGSTRCLPGALPQANLCCPVGAKSKGGELLRGAGFMARVHFRLKYVSRNGIPGQRSRTI